MIEEAINRLQFLCNTIPALLAEIGEEAFTFKPHPDKWSKKEILGHLIDSATNNHHRFVRTQFESLPAISYDQNRWNTFGYYNEIDSAQLIQFWTSYNKQLTELIKYIPEGALNRKCKAGGNDVTLEFLISDYVVHLEHHLKQMVNY